MVEGGREERLEEARREARELPLADVEHIWFEYDRQNDILYINFGYDVEDADEEVMTGDGIVVRIKGGRVVGITVFDFSRRIGGQP